MIDYTNMEGRPSPRRTPRHYDPTRESKRRFTLVIGVVAVSLVVTLLLMIEGAAV